MYKKSNLLDEVLKMYKRAAGDYNRYNSPEAGVYSDRHRMQEQESFESLGNTGHADQSKLDDTNIRYQSKCLYSLTII